MLLKIVYSVVALLVFTTASFATSLPCEGLCDPSSQECTASQCTCLVPFPPLPGESCQDPCFGQCDRATEICQKTATGFECQCRPGYYRSAYGCVEFLTYQALFEIESIDETNVEFYEDLTDRESESFIALEIEVCALASALYNGVPGYYGCAVLEFRNGSIIADIQVYFDPSSNVTEDTLNAEVQRNMVNGSLTSEFSVFSISSYSVVPTDECALGIDDCSVNALCTDMAENGFVCTCLEGYSDVEGYPPGTHCLPYLTTSQTGTWIQSTTEEEISNDNNDWKIVVIATSVCLFVIVISAILMLMFALRFTNRSRKRYLSFIDIINSSDTPEETVLTDEQFPWHEPPQNMYVYHSSTVNDMTESKIAAANLTSEQQTYSLQNDTKVEEDDTRERTISGARMNELVADLLSFVRGPQMRGNVAAMENTPSTSHSEGHDSYIPEKT